MSMSYSNVLALSHWNLSLVLAYFSACVRKAFSFNSKDPCLRLLPTVWAQENKMNKHVGWLPTVSSSCESSKVRLPWKRRLGLEEPTKLLLQSDLHAKPCANSPRTPATAGAVQQVQLRSVERLRSDRLAISFGKSLCKGAEEPEVSCWWFLIGEYWWVWLDGWKLFRVMSCGGWYLPQTKIETLVGWMVTLRLFGNDKKPLRCQDLQRLHLKLANKCDKGRQNGWASHFLGGSASDKL